MLFCVIYYIITTWIVKKSGKVGKKAFPGAGKE
jgi:hypothetical protein